MKAKNIVFWDLLKCLSHEKFNEIVERYEGDKWSKQYTSWDLFITLLQGQLVGDTSLRMVALSHQCQEVYLKQLDAKWMPRSTISDACKIRKPEVWMDVFNHILSQLQGRHKKLIKAIGPLINLIDSTPVLLKGYGYEWAKDNHRIKGLKAHVVYDKELESPVYLTMTDANVNDITEAKKLRLKKGVTYVFDKGYFDYSWWNELHLNQCRFVTRLKKNAPFKILKRQDVKADNIRHDWIIKISSEKGRKFKDPLRHLRVKLSTGKSIDIVSNDLKSSAEEIAELYKRRWDIELFFKCIKQNLKIKRFWFESENGVKLQIITAMITYLLLRMGQLCTQTTKSIQQIRIIVCLKLYETSTLYRILKDPDKATDRLLKAGVAYD
jgi:hypothetical protein